MNHRRMIRYRRHRGYGASALSFVTACWNGLWKETLFSVSSVSSVVSLLLCLFFLSSCHYARPNLSSEEMPQKTKDSLNYLYDIKKSTVIQRYTVLFSIICLLIILFLPKEYLLPE